MMLRTEQLCKRFDSFCLREISLEVARGEYYVLLGRSGAGKTQLLELICGLTHPDKGSIFLEGEDITRKRVQDRGIGLVFQDLALFPHYTVKDNIMYPLKLRDMPLRERIDRVQRAAEEMNITDLLLRKPGNLSGGEKQRVALARTLVTDPKILLLDEPMASVDASLKDSIRRMLRRLNRNGQTIVHVTHDFGEAVSLASRVGVMHNGRIIQDGTPAEVFNHPVNRFVARYAGIKNFFRVTFVKSYNSWSCITDNRTRFRLAKGDYPSSGLMILAAGEVLVTRQGAAGVQINNIHGVIEDIVPSPSGYEITVNGGDRFYADITHREMEARKFVTGEPVIVSFRPESLRLVGNGEEKKEY
ncbi:MAG: ABC transporter ATP-binding protein [Bacteroidales bacterium]|nr:ABC transporter ATP-binding protein [Bacteroidales bacterium]NLD64930.1 ABC transporter ATP-binding protein [Bacteroidales bacterium]